ACVPGQVERKSLLPRALREHSHLSLAPGCRHRRGSGRFRRLGKGVSGRARSPARRPRRLSGAALGCPRAEGLADRRGAEPGRGESGPSEQTEKVSPAERFWTEFPLEPGSGEKHSRIAKLAQDASAGVVNVHTSKTVVRDLMPGFPFEMFPEFFGGQRGRRGGPPPRQEYKVPSLGSGFVISPDGYIVTNNHVVEGVDEIKVHFADGKVLDAKIVGTDPKTDLALIQVSGAKDLPALPLGDSD